MQADRDRTACPAETAGLTGDEAAGRLLQSGPNELPRDRQRGAVRIILDAVREPMLQLLLAAGGIYLVLGDLAEALILLAFAGLNVALVAVQDSRTEHALASLKDLTSPRALVIRDGGRQTIVARDLVPGDLIVLSEGDRVPADAVLIAVAGMEADEALLTGESVPVRKAISDVEGDQVRPGGDGNAHIWSGSLIVRGSGMARVTATGVHTEIGRIGTTLNTVESAPTPLQLQVRQLVRVFAVAGTGASIFLAIVYGLLHGTWVKAILAGITLAMATLPEEFPLVLNVFLVLGAWRIAKSHVVARRSSAIEALGAATILCSDKTGTLTRNRMSVTRLMSGDAELSLTASLHDLPESVHELVEFAILASRPDPVDPMEQAFHDIGQRFLARTEHLHSEWSLFHSYPLDPHLLAMSQMWQARSGDACVIASKGAPEAIADLCHLPAECLAAIRRDVAHLADQGLRVLAVAKGLYKGPFWPDSQHDFDFSFLGLIGLADPLRQDVPESIAACAAAGIKVAMITGDHPATALAIAGQAGIVSEDVLTGAEMEAMSDADLALRIRRTRVFARIMPEQKLRLVQAFVAGGEVVAMTGDGVNDAPSLKAAHIGVAMGGRGADVARSAASLVLLDDSFTSLVSAVRLGRRIDDNLRKAISYILAVHVPIAGMSLLPVLFGWPLLLGPIHVVFLELIIDPVSSIVFEAEPEEPGVMARPPRDPTAPLFGVALMARGLLQGGVVLAAALGVFLLGIQDQHGEDVARGMAFITLVLGNLGLVLTNRSLGVSAFITMRRPNPALGLVIVTTLLALLVTLGVPWMRDLFAVAPLTLGQIGEAIGAGAASLVGNDLLDLALAWIRGGRAGATRIRPGVSPDVPPSPAHDSPAPIRTPRPGTRRNPRAGG